MIEKSGCPQLISAGYATKAEFDEALTTFKKYQDLISNKNAPVSENCIGKDYYLSVQSAIDVIAKNYPRFIPQSSSDSYAQYHGFKLDMFPRFLISCATSQYFSETGRLINTYTKEGEGELASFIEKNRYLYDCVINYRDIAGRSFVDYGDMDWISFSVWWAASSVPLYKSFYVNLTKESLLFNPAIAPNTFGKEISASSSKIRVPDYMIINGLLHTTKWTYSEEWWEKIQKASYDGNAAFQMILTEYFAAYPERIEEYNQCIEDFFCAAAANKQEKDEVWKEITSLKSQNEASEKVCQQVQSEMNSFINEVSRLKRKIFGKAKAQQQITELNAKIDELSANLSKCKAGIEQRKTDLVGLQERYHKLFELDYDGPDGTSSLMCTLLNKFDSFGVWKPVDETQSIKPLAETIA